MPNRPCSLTGEEYSGADVACIVRYASRHVSRMRADFAGAHLTHLLPDWLQVEDSALPDTKSMKSYEAIARTLSGQEPFLLSVARVAAGMCAAAPTLYSQATAVTLGTYAIWLSVVERHHWTPIGELNVRALQFAPPRVFDEHSEPTRLAEWIERAFVPDPFASLMESVADTPDSWAAAARHGDTQATRALLTAMFQPLQWLALEFSPTPIDPIEQRDLALTSFRFALAAYSGEIGFIPHLAHNLWRNIGGPLSDVQYVRLLDAFAARVESAMLLRGLRETRSRFLG